MTTTARLAMVALLFLATGAGAREPVSFPVSFESEDGFVLHGDLVSSGSTESPVAILLHMYRHDRKSWAPLVPALTARGITVLALAYQRQFHWWPLIPGVAMILIKLEKLDYVRKLFQNWPLLLVIVGVLILISALARKPAKGES